MRNTMKIMILKIMILMIMMTLLWFPFYQWGQSLEPNKGVENLDFLGSTEKEVIRELNLARTDPAGYAEFIKDYKRYYVGNLIRIAGQTPIRTQEGVTAVDEAIEFLENAGSCLTLRVSKGLSRAAEDHVEDQSPSGETGHQGSDNSSPLQRMLRYGEIRGGYGENIAYGEYNARQVVMQLIIDDGVPDRGHRENIFTCDFRVVGLHCGAHHRYGTMCVMNFATSYKEKD